jgi:DNA-binding LacI/PurR family transcriptional regulator/ABC-type glycerol-3-phosphate transport system substrate-binding protein
LPTIKDVAKLAGVSLGTVSNVLNGYKSVKSDIVKRVESAVKELGYQPNLKARSIRNSKTNCIGVLLPNSTDNIYIRLYNGVERIASEAGYSVSLYISNDSPETEEILLLRMQQQRMDGAVIVTCMPGETDVFDQLLKSGTQLVFVRRKPADMRDKTYFGIDEKQAIFYSTSGLLKEGCGEIALLTGREEYSNEKDCIDGYLEAKEAFGISTGKSDVTNISDGNESAFRAASWWLCSEKIPQAIITTCPEYANGVMAAVLMFRGQNRPLVITLDNDNWVHGGLARGIILLVQKYTRLGEEAAKKLLGMIESEYSSPESTVLPAEPFLPSLLMLRGIRGMESQKKRRRPGRLLRILMLENTSSVAGNLMKSVFTAETGIRVEIDTLPYESMYDHTIGRLRGKGNAGGDPYDLIQINIPWISEAIRRGIIVRLDNELKADSVIHTAFSPEILEQHGMYEGHLYAVPFMVGTQLLFYRKDLFRDLRIRRLYYEKNRTALEVPAAWKDYDRIAEFFTKQFNPESPVPYGVTLGRVNGLYYYILRLWEAGISLFEEQSLGSAEVFKTAEDILAEYIRSYNFADPAAKNWNQSEQANQFCRGNSAMMVIYQAHFADHVYKYESHVYKENIGFAPLPGRTSILGGWSLGVSSGSTMRGEALCFLEWLSKEDTSIPYNILGGSIPGKAVFNSSEMRETYPWLSQTFDGVKNTRTMIDPGIKWISQWEFEFIAENILNKLLDGQISIRKVLEDLFRQLVDIKNSSNLK